MKKNKKLFLNSMFSIFALAILGTSGGVLAACTGAQNSKNFSTKYDKSLAKKLSTQYKSEFNEALGNQLYYQMTKENQPKLEAIVEKYLKQVNSILEDESSLIGMSLDAKIWLKAFQFELDTKLKLIKSNIRYLIVSSNDQMTMMNWKAYFQNDLLSAANQWYENGELMSFAQKSNHLQGVLQYITDVYNNLKEGLEEGITWSGVITKHTIGNMLQKLFNNFLVDVANNTNTSTNEPKTNIFSSNPNYDKWQATASEENKQSIKTLITKVEEKLNELMKFLMNDYYKKVNYGKANSLNEYKLEVSDTNPNEEDNGFKLTSNGQTKYIKNLGLNDDDIKQKDVGIGFMPNKKGEPIYQALLQKHSNVLNPSTQQQIELGKSGVDDIKAAMTAVANNIADLKVGKGNEWKETYMFDQDSSGDAHGSEEQKDKVIRKADGTVELKVFFEWLNSDQFFNGRDMTQNQEATIDGVTVLQKRGQTPKLIANNKKPYQYTPYYLDENKQLDIVEKVIGFNKDSNPDKTITNGDAGNLYVKYIEKSLSPATIQSSDTITTNDMNNDIEANAAYIGASHAVSQYLIYKESVNNHIKSMFKDTPADYTLRTGTGGAAYASSGAGATDWVDKGWGGFYLDVNPYSGLQKWSMSTLANHEGVSGHVFQFAYADVHPADEDAVRFSSTAYSEGWGLFSEWLATQIGVYGEPTKQGSLTIDSQGIQAKDLLSLPKFGTNSKTTDITQPFSPVSESNLENYANGVYQVNGTNNQQYYDALQYFGFLNERQLRAMRVTVDLALHSGKDGDYSTGSGYSLKDTREYLQANSGLGLDDINRESKRYLEYTGQATSYYNGLVELQNYFLKDKFLFEITNRGQTYLNWENPAATQKNTAGIFDLLLRNGSVPMPVLSWAVNEYLQEKYSNIKVEDILGKNFTI